MSCACILCCGPAATLAVAERLADRPRAPLYSRIGRVTLALVHAIAGDSTSGVRLLARQDSRWPNDPPTAVTRHVALALARAGDLAAASAAGETAEAVALSAGFDYELGLPDMHGLTWP
jgi:hypothetical protein